MDIEFNKTYLVHLDTRYGVIAGNRQMTYARICDIDSSVFDDVSEKFANEIIKIVENETESIEKIFGLKIFIFEKDYLNKPNGNLSEFEFMIRSDKEFSEEDMEKVLKNLLTDIKTEYEGVYSIGDDLEERDYTISVETMPNYMYVERTSYYD